MKIVVRHALYIQHDGRLTPCGARLIRGPEILPRILTDENDELRFHFDNSEAAQRAAAALEKYINAQSK